MTVAKFKIDLSGLPPEILQEDEGDTVLKLRVRTVTGRTTILLRDQEVVRTEDPFITEALTNYRPPRIPIKHHPGGAESVAYHDYGDYEAIRPLATVAANTTHQHVL